MRLDVKIGDRYNKLTIIKEVNSKNGRRKFLCECDCKNRKEVLLEKLRSGSVKSCGCLLKKHGKYKIKEYKLFIRMKDRCFNKKNINYKNYGGRGITICERWSGENGFVNFYSDMGDKPTPKHSIDRIDNNLGYFPDNCKWATSKEQANNRRSNVIITYAGKTKNISQWAEYIGISDPSLRVRLKRGWSIERALNYTL